MLALTLHGTRDLRCESLEAPKILQPHEALVRVHKTALCGSDLHPYRGLETGFDPGTIMGHEFVGEVMDVGSAVKELRFGQEVFSPFSTCCGSCSCCDSGLTSRCPDGQLLGWVESGLGLHGAQAEIVKVPLADSTLLEIPRGISQKTALLLGDNLATGYYGCIRAGVKAGESCVVIGCGTVGLLAVLSALELGASTVYAVDPLESRRARAEELGAKALTPEQAQELESSRIVEAVGNLSAMRLAYDVASPGATLASVGVHTTPGFAFTPAEVYDKNLTYRSGRCPARGLAEELFPIARAQQATLESLFTHELSLSDGPDAYKMFDQGDDDCQKVLFSL